MLDIGCGAGGLAIELAKRVPRVIGIDITPAMIEAARGGSGEAQFIQGNAETYNFEQQFDLITSIFSLEHCDRAAMFHKLTYLLKPGGTFIAIDCNAGDRTAPLLDLLMYYRFRLRHRLGLNLIATLRNVGKMLNLINSPPWKLCRVSAVNCKMTYLEYQSFVKSYLPTAKVESVDSGTSLIIFQRGLGHGHGIERTGLGDNLVEEA